jgi:hypothetical protein
VSLLDDGGLRVLNADLVNQGTVDLGADLDLNSVVQNGRIALNGHTLNVDGALAWESGFIDGPGTLAMQALEVSGARALEGVSLEGSSLRLSGSGALALSGGSLDAFDTSIDSGLELTLLNSQLSGDGTLTVEGTVTVALGSETASVNLPLIRVIDQGQILIPAGTSLGIEATSVEGSGRVVIDGVLGITALTLASTFDVAGIVNGDTLMVTDSGIVRLLDGELDLNELTLTGGALVGNGVVNGMVFNDGLVAPGSSIGLITIVGNYVQGPNGVLEIEVGSGPPFVAGVNHDGLLVDGDVSIDGTIRIVPLDDAAELEGVEFVPLSFTGTASGQFAVVEPEGIDLRLTEEGLVVAEQSLIEEIIEEILEFLEEEGRDELVSTDEVVALADEQSELEGCDNDDVEDPAATTAGEHGVGCRGM